MGRSRMDQTIACCLVVKSALLHEHDAPGSAKIRACIARTRDIWNTLHQRSKKKRRWHSAQQAPKRKCSVTSRNAKTLEQLLRELQHRDATPEDYELLLQLDESVKKKTLTQEQIDALPEVRLEELLQVVEAQSGEVDSI